MTVAKDSYVFASEYAVFDWGISTIPRGNIQVRFTNLGGKEHICDRFLGCTTLSIRGVVDTLQTSCSTSQEFVVFPVEAGPELLSRLEFTLHPQSHSMQSRCMTVGGDAPAG